jgi:hypothetical protein
MVYPPQTFPSPDNSPVRVHRITPTGQVSFLINGETHYLWRAIDQEGEALESTLPSPSISSIYPLQRKGHPQMTTPSQALAAPLARM